MWAMQNEITGEMIKGGGDRVVDWIWRLCNMAFESGVVPGDCRSAVIVPLYKGKVMNIQYQYYKSCSNYRGITLLSVVGKIYTAILVERIRKVTEGLIDDVQGEFRVEWGV